MKKAATILFVFIIITICATPLILNVVGFDSPSMEKRVALQMPSLLLRSRELNTGFTQELDTYIAGSFPLRTWMISAWHRLNILFSGQSGNENVVAGDDDWLFYSADLPSYLGHDRLTDAQYARLDANLSLQARFLSEREINFLYLVVPNKSTIYPDKMPDRYDQRLDSNALSGLEANLQTPGLIDARQVLINAAQTEGQLLYHRTDTHWNNRGALLASQEFLDQAGRLLGKSLSIPQQETPATERADWSGDLAVMLYPSGSDLDLQQYYEYEPGFRYTRPIKSLEDLLITTQGPGEYSLLMFRDSFANALIPMLSEAFASAAYSRSIPYDYALLERIQPDLVVLEIVERNLPDWLTTPPRMPALSFTGEVPESLNTNDVDHHVSIVKDGAYWQITGTIAGPRMTSDWTGILVNVQDTWYEAFTVTDFSNPSTAGYVFYLDINEAPQEPIVKNARIAIGQSWLEAGAP